ncbi:MAG: hypothetical protein IKI41_04230 [Clostridia bacterium]|nr:hypothetical protein [Clostridia bacterium]
MDFPSGNGDISKNGGGFSGIVDFPQRNNRALENCGFSAEKRPDFGKLWISHANNRITRQTPEIPVNWKNRSGRRI